MDALSYELLIRRVNETGRTNVNGANADIYRTMERAYRHLTDPGWAKSKETKEYDYRKAYATVHQHVTNAVWYGQELIKHLISQADDEKLQGVRKKIEEDRSNSKEILDKCIEEADAIFRRYGLEPK